MLLVVSKAAKPSQADFASKCIPPTSDKLGEVQAKVDRKSKNYNALQATLIMALALPQTLTPTSTSTRTPASPTSDARQAMGEAIPNPNTDPNPNPDPDPNPHPNQAMGEAIPALGWVMVEKTPG